jgi:hypothetical protein
MTMQDQENATLTHHNRVPWNKGKVTGAKPPLRPKHVWSIRTKLQIEGRARDLAMFNLAIDSKSRDQSCRATRRSLVQTDACHHGSPQADRGDRFNPTSTSPNLRQNPHSARGSAPAYVTRFRALALFGRRLQERVDSVGIPSSKNLHSSGQ